MNFYKTLAFWMLVSSKGFALVTLLNSSLFPLIFIPLAAISLSIILEKNSHVKKMQILLSVLFLYYDPILPSLMLLTYVGIKSCQLFYDSRCLPLMLAVSEISLSIISIALVPLSPLSALANASILSAGLKSLKKQSTFVLDNFFPNSFFIQTEQRSIEHLGLQPQIGFPLFNQSPPARNYYFPQDSFDGHPARQQHHAAQSTPQHLASFNHEYSAPTAPLIVRFR